MIVFPNAKINIGLRIISRRPDGYHDLETIFHPVRLYDALEFVALAGGQRDILTVTGFDAGIPDANLVIRASTMLHGKYDFPALKIHLHKAIPPGAGLGGGSADAACFLKAVSRHFSLPVTDTLLKEMALYLGSDCPFFIDNVPSFATGRGEILKPAGNFTDKLYVVLLNPGIHAGTRDAYAECRPAEPDKSLDDLVRLPVESWKDQIVNDFEYFVFRKYPLIQELKKFLYETGAVFSLMSGSGSTVYGLFREKPLISGAFRKYLIYSGVM